LRKTFSLCALLSAVLCSGAAAQEARPGALPTELPLHTAIAAGDLDTVRRLLQSGADPDAVVSLAGSDRRTPLGILFHEWPGTQEGSHEVLRLLLAAGANPNGSSNMYGAPGADEPPLVSGATSPAALGMLLKAGADPNLAWCFMGMEYTPLLMAEMAGENEAIALLRAANARRSSLDLALARDPAAAALHAAVFEQDVARIRQLLEAGSDPNAALVGLTFVNGMVERVRPLRLVFSRDGGELPPEWRRTRNEAVRLLLDAGADANEPVHFTCGFGSPTPLLMAAADGDEELVQLLLKGGADVHRGTEAFGASLLRPLTMAAAEGHVRIVQLLLDAGADVNAVDEADGVRLTALDVALSDTPVSAARAAIADMLRSRGGTALAPERQTPDAAQDDGQGDDAPLDFLRAFHDGCNAGSRFDSSSPELGVGVRYEIVGQDGSGCRVAFTYESNPNPEWERKPLLLTLDPRQRFMDEIAAGLGGCASGQADRFNCAGPLLELLRRE
jgi:ankyrin repeat protein